MTEFDTYQGAFTISRKNLDCKFKHMEVTLILLENVIVPCYHAFTGNVTYDTLGRQMLPDSLTVVFCMIDLQTVRWLLGLKAIGRYIATGAAVYRERE
jgi:hypothetical protein